jgi:two-component system, chemotaxis family, protein-glutamate methylesterase/glutaminase
MVSPSDLFGQKLPPTPIRVMLVDDSRVVLAVFARILSDNAQIEIVHQATNVADAIDFLRGDTVDVILLDIEMPDRSGLDALPDILAVSSGAKVMIVSAFVEQGGHSAISALELGACETLSKPGKTRYSGKFSGLLRDRVIQLGRSNREKETSIKRHQTVNMVEPISTPDCIAIASSTGGLPAIYTLIGKLDARVDCPIFITQHLPEAFITFFAKQLADATNRRVKVSSCGEKIEKSMIYVAPGNANLGLTIVDGVVTIKHFPKRPGTTYCPSADVMFESVAKRYGASALAIVFSGMGNDGLEGARELASENAIIVAQDAESSVVWGMPGSIVRAGLATFVLNPERLVEALNLGCQN